jgi:hypothetical protein
LQLLQALFLDVRTVGGGPDVPHVGDRMTAFHAPRTDADALAWYQLFGATSPDNLAHFSQGSGLQNASGDFLYVLPPAEAFRGTLSVGGSCSMSSAEPLRARCCRRPATKQLRNLGRPPVFEEFIHTTQFRNGKVNKLIEQFGNAEAERLLKIEPAEKLIQNQRTWKLPQNEGNEVTKRLEHHRKQGGR